MGEYFPDLLFVVSVDSLLVLRHPICRVTSLVVLLLPSYVDDLSLSCWGLLVSQLVLAGDEHSPQFLQLVLVRCLIVLL